MKGLQLNGIPFTNLRICYFRVLDMSHEQIFLDATDEQILIAITKHHETAIIIKIENVEVLEVITHIPKKRKLDINELKIGISNEERLERATKIADMKNKYR